MNTQWKRTGEDCCRLDDVWSVRRQGPDLLWRVYRGEENVSSPFLSRYAAQLQAEGMREEEVAEV